MRSGERFGQEDYVWTVFLDLANDPLPECKGFGVGIVDAKNAYALVDPELEHALQFFPQCAPTGGFKIQRIDVLIFFGGIFRVLDGTVGSGAEPLRMLTNVGVIGRALKGNVQC